MTGFIPAYGDNQTSIPDSWPEVLPRQYYVTRSPTGSICFLMLLPGYQQFFHSPHQLWHLFVSLFHDNVSFQNLTKFSPMLLLIVEEYFDILVQNIKEHTFSQNSCFSWWVYFLSYPPNLRPLLIGLLIRFLPWGFPTKVCMHALSWIFTCLLHVVSI
jgi:hypothetical protein